VAQVVDIGVTAIKASVNFVIFNKYLTFMIWTKLSSLICRAASICPLIFWGAPLAGSAGHVLRTLKPCAGAPARAHKPMLEERGEILAALCL
jgi:hypothetical protein